MFAIQFTWIRNEIWRGIIIPWGHYLPLRHSSTSDPSLLTWSPQSNILANESKFLYELSSCRVLFSNPSLRSECILSLYLYAQIVPQVKLSLLNISRG